MGIVGYDDKQRVLLDKIIDKMLNFKVDRKRFAIWKENVIFLLLIFLHVLYIFIYYFIYYYIFIIDFYIIFMNFSILEV